MDAPRLPRARLEPPAVRAIARDRVDRLLDRAWTAALTVVVGPAGAGKSTAVGHLVQRSTHPGDLVPGPPGRRRPGDVLPARRRGGLPRHRGAVPVHRPDRARRPLRARRVRRTRAAGDRRVRRRHRHGDRAGARPRHRRPAAVPPHRHALAPPAVVQPRPAAPGATRCARSARTTCASGRGRSTGSSASCTTGRCRPTRSPSWSAARAGGSPPCSCSTWRRPACRRTSAAPPSPTSAAASARTGTSSPRTCSSGCPTNCSGSCSTPSRSSG